MKKYIMMISVAILLSTVLLCGCNGENENNNVAEKTFIGTWKIDMEGPEDYSQTWIFKEDNTATRIDNFGGEISTEFYEWSDDGTNYCSKPIGGPPDSERCGNYEFFNNNNSFKWIIMEQEIIFTRVS